MESEKEMEFLKEDLLSQNVGSNMKDLERKFKKCKGRTRLFKKMKSNYERAGRWGVRSDDVTVQLAS